VKLQLKVVIQHYAVVVTVAVSHVVLLCGFSRTERVSVSSAAEGRRLPVHDHTAFRLVPRPRPEPHVQGSPSHTVKHCRISMNRMVCCVTASSLYFIGMQKAHEK